MAEELEKKAKETLEARKDEPASEDTGKGSKSEASGLVDKANVAAERLEKANEKTEALVNRLEEVTAKRMLAGKTEAGQEAKEKTQEETDQEEAKRRVEEFQ